MFLCVFLNIYICMFSLCPFIVSCFNLLFVSNQIVKKKKHKKKTNDVLPFFLHVFHVNPIFSRSIQISLLLRDLVPSIKPAAIEALSFSLSRSLSVYAGYFPANLTLRSCAHCSFSPPEAPPPLPAAAQSELSSVSMTRLSAFVRLLAQIRYVAV